MENYKDKYDTFLKEMTGKVSANSFNASKGDTKVTVDITSNDTLTFTVGSGGNAKVYTMDALETKEFMKFVQRIK